MKKKLVFDASVLVTGYLSGNIYTTGIYRATYEILNGLIKCDTYIVYLFDIYRRERELRKFIVSKFEQAQVLPLDSNLYRAFGYPLFNHADNFRIKEYQSGKISSKYLFRFFKNCLQTLGRGFRYIERERTIHEDNIRLCNDDIYLSTYNRFPANIGFLSKLHKAIIIHDLIPVIHPDYFYSHENKEILEDILNSITDSTTVICVSESTKRDFLRIKSGHNPGKVFVTHLAGADCFHPELSIKLERDIKEKFKIPFHKSYYLSVCTIEPRKNIGLLISAYERLLKQKLDIEIPLLVLTGVIGWKSKTLIEKINQVNTNFPNAIILTGFIPDEELVVLYSNARCFIYPSLYEGFGLPPLEAMNCGAPVITSNNSSLPEVVGNAAIMIDANDEDAILNSLVLCLDKAIVYEMKEKSLQRASLFSWDRTINSLTGILNSIE